MDRRWLGQTRLERHIQRWCNCAKRDFVGTIRWGHAARHRQYRDQHHVQAVDWERNYFYLPFDALASFRTKKTSRHYVSRRECGSHECATCLYSGQSLDLRMWG